jgi:uncharacterized membrane protein YdbT with pleckstrin-like domain
MLSVFNLPNNIPNEQMIKVVRRDFFILFKKLVVLLFLIIMPFLFLALLVYTQPDLLTGEVSYPLIVIGLSAYYLFAWLFFFFSFIDYYLDVWIITNERIIAIEQKGFFSRTIAEQRLYRIQDVTSDLKGILPTILNYGEVHVQTAGEVQRFIFSQVPDPEGIRSIIIQLAEKSKAIHKEEK